MKLVKSRIVTWSEIETWTKDVVGLMDRDRFLPEVVIGLTRGGWVPARLLCDLMGVKDLYAVKTEHWGITATRDGEAKLTQKLAVDVKGKRTLIMDDITDTGKSLELAREHVNAFSPGAMKSATLLHITHSSIEPDYYAVEVQADDWTWFIFPWNFNEDIRTLVAEAMKHGRTPVEVQETLQRRCELTVGLDVIEDVMSSAHPPEGRKGG